VGYRRTIGAAPELDKVDAPYPAAADITRATISFAILRVLSRLRFIDPDSVFHAADRGAIGTSLKEFSCSRGM
jgi:hypothetical protein